MKEITGWCRLWWREFRACFAARLIPCAAHLSGAASGPRADCEALFRTGRSRLPWRHTLYDAKEIVQESAAKVHVSVHFTRYLEGGTKFSEHDSLYIAVCREGRWGIAVRSSFVPVMRPPEAP